jgi:hypothetical protein
MRAAVHAVESGRAPHWHGEAESVDSLRGRLAFSNAINPQQALPLMVRLGRAAPVGATADRGSEPGDD